MAGRGRILVLGLGLGWLGAGCASPPRGVPALSNPAPAQVPQKPVAAPPPSPYHVVPQQPVLREAVPTPPPLERVHYPAPVEPETKPQRLPATVVAEEAGRPEDPPLIQALRCYLDKKPGEAVALLESYGPVNQEMLLALLPLAARLTGEDIRQAGPQELAATLAQLNSLAAPLRNAAALSLGRVCFCERVQHFGAYTPLAPDYVFRPGERVQLYLEVKNFSSEPRGNLYVTRTAVAVRVFDYMHKELWSHEFPRELGLDVSRSPRQDLSHSLSFALPQLPPGSYTLQVQAEDLPTRRRARRTVDFRVGTVTSPTR